MILPYKRKILPIHFENILSGNKTFELRKEDREQFEPYHFIHLYEWSEEKFTGRILVCSILAVHREIEGIEKGFAILSIRLDRAYTENENEGVSI